MSCKASATMTHRAKPRRSLKKAAGAMLGRVALPAGAWLIEEDLALSTGKDLDYAKFWEDMAYKAGPQVSPALPPQAGPALSADRRVA